MTVFFGARKVSYVFVLAFVVVGGYVSSAIGQPVVSKNLRKVTGIQPAPVAYILDSVKSGPVAKALIPSTLIYNIGAPGPYSSADSNFLVVQELSIEGSSSPKLHNFTVEALPTMFDLQVSPNYRYVMLKSGLLEERASTYDIYLWDLASNARRIVQGPQEGSSDRHIVWSPDSRYFCFFAGEIVGRSGLDYDLTHSLTCFDVVTGRSNRIRFPSSEGRVTWSTRGNLLMSRVRDTVSPQVGTAASRAPHVRLSDIFEVPVSRDKPRLLVTAAGGTISESPDGQWVLCQGWPELDKKGGSRESERAAAQKLETFVSPYPHGLYLYSRSQRTKFPVKGAGDMATTLDSLDFFDYAMWGRDSANVVIMRGPSVLVLDVKTRLAKSLAEVSGKVDEADLLEDERRHYRPLGFSRDGSLLIVEVAERTESTEVKTVDMRTGAVSLMAKLTRAHGVAWVPSLLKPMSGRSMVAKPARTKIDK